MVHETLLHGELLESADSLSARLVEALGGSAEAETFARAERGDGPINLEVLGQLARRLARVEEILDVLRDGAPPDRRSFDALRGRLADYGIEAEMARDRAAAAPAGGRTRDEDEEEDGE
jgi:hypothetical protein